MPRINQLTTRTPAGADLLPFDKDIGGGSFLTGKATFREVMEGTRGLDTFATRAAFVAANTATPGLGLSDGQVVVAGGYEYRRSGASTAISDLPGWVPNGWGFFEQWGVVGDGVVDDKTAFQAALDSGWAYLKGTPGAVYRLVTAAICPSNRTIDLNGATLRRGGTAQFLFETEKARTTWDAANITLYNWSCDDDGTVATRGNFNLLIGDNIRVYRANILARAPYTGGEGAWCFYISGENCEVHDLTANTEAAGLFSDCIHVGYVKNFVLGAHHLRGGDDGIALYPAPRSYPWCGKNLKSQNVTIMPGFVSSTEANGIRIGAQEYLDPVTNASPANTGWENVNIVGETVGQCKAALDLTDRRTTADITAGNKNTEISVKINLIDQSANATRLILLEGNPGITSAANRTQHNFGRVKIEVNGRQTFGTGGTAGQIFYGGGADRLEMSGDLISDPSAAVGVTHCSFFQIDDLVLTSVTGRTDTTAAFILLTYVRRFYLENPDFTNDGNTEFQAISVALNTDQDTSVYVNGGRINDTARVINITGTGAMRDFHLVGTQIAGTVVTNPNLSVPTSWTAGGTVIFEPAGGYRTTVGGLYGATIPVLEGSRAFVTDANATTFASIVAAGGANKVPVYRDGTAWRIG